MKKNIAIIIKANQDFVRHTEADVKKSKPILNTFFESISKVYIPLLEMLGKFEREGLQVKIGLVLPPILCNLLSDDSVKDLYLGWLEEKNSLGIAELDRNKDNEKITSIVKAEIERNSELKNLFTNVFSRDLVKSFADFAKKGFVELLGTSGTDIFFPHYADMREIISAQVESGLHSYRQFFGNIPEGFWLPDFGYTPGVEKLIKAYGFSYTIADARSLLLSEKLPEKGIFYPVRTENSLALFANDPDCYDDVFDSEEGFVNQSAYRNEKRDIGFELPIEKLSPLMDQNEVRFETGFKYWNRNFVKGDDNLNYYSVSEAGEQAEKDAASFVQKREKLLSSAAASIPDSDFVSLVCCFNSDDLRSWNESLIWLEKVLRKFSASEVRLAFCKELLEKQYELEKISPYFSAGNGTGYGENLLSNRNSWMMRYIRKACERIVDLSDRFPNDTGLKTRLLNLGAKELMLAQSLNLAKMIENEDNADFAIKRFKDSIEAFTIVFDSLGSNTVSTEWLTTLELKDSFFPWMNYRIFSKKK